ncbi:XRE family transcriptional regulator [Pandoraea terrae]|uniref:XRE family transcriptional regulator n=1 Tax=Pandoraea terrae TaxID=1537710 RepID=A0A5E4SBR4_9BURK|nr:helix-turn-helix domain-containing protein [Pandoraea terrae]VVD72601.1 XRE family transcriptional regulator [Pandoraea terrae]
MAVETEARSTDDWMVYVGDQCRAMRLRANWDQETLAQRADVSVGAVKNLEGGKGSSMTTMIKVLRALQRTDWLEALAPRISVSPMQMLKASRHKAPRQRVSRPRKRAHGDL